MPPKHLLILSDKVNQLDKKMDTVFRILKGDEETETTGLMQRVQDAEQAIKDGQLSTMRRILNWTQANTAATIISLATILSAIVGAIAVLLR